MLVVAAIDATQKVKDLGAYAGFASILGLAVLSVLYFGQARELKRLREWAGRAPERAAEMQARAAAGAPAPAAPQPAATPRPRAVPGAPAATGVVGAPNGAAPSPAPATAAATAAGAAAPVAAAPIATPGADAADPPAAVPAAVPAAADGGATAMGASDEAVSAAATASDATQAIPAIDPDEAGLPPIPPVRTAPAAPLRAGAPGVTLPPRTPAGAGPIRFDDPEPQHGSRVKAIAAILAGIVVLGLGAAFAAGAFSGGDDTGKGTSTATGAAKASTGTTSSSARPATPPINRSDFEVAVRNGTSINNAARGVVDRLGTRGYRGGQVGTLAGASIQTTQVAYKAGRKRQALDVARLLTVSAADVVPADAAALSFGQGADVIVTLGADKAQ